MIILQDTKEKMPWSFASYEQCKIQKQVHLTEGDYTLEEYPFLIIIERKKSVAELANNLGAKYTQFRNEMEKLQSYRFRYIICEFSELEVINYPHTSKLPAFIKSKIRMNGKFLIKRIQHIINCYGIEFIYCHNRYNAIKKAMDLLLNAEYIYQKERINTK